jgi:hypothetical protein
MSSLNFDISAKALARGRHVLSDDAAAAARRLPARYLALPSSPVMPLTEK